jgi:putative transposase
MPLPRILLTPNRLGVHYHCVSRVVDRNFVFDVHERDVFRKIMRQVEAFSGVRVLTWTILSNHFHLLVEVPAPPTTPLTHDQILDRCRALYSDDQMIAVESEFADAKRTGGNTLEELHGRFIRRMWDLSEFIKTVKQKFTLWFNRTHDRVGTLWESRFNSVLVEGERNTLLKVAAYIDLNAVRAGIVDDPKEYCWCGYSEAVAGDAKAREGLAVAFADVKPDTPWREMAPRYRKLLFGIGAQTDTRAGISPEAIAKVWAAGGKLSVAQVLRCRVRHFTDGLAVGSAAFIERVFQIHRAAFGDKRQSGARRLRGDPLDGLCSARALRKSAITCGDG